MGLKKNWRKEEWEERRKGGRKNGRNEIEGRREAEDTAQGKERGGRKEEGGRKG